MKMKMEEFIQRQEEFEGYKVRFKTKWKDGSINHFERLINDKFCKPNEEFFKIIEVEILEFIGVTTIKVKDNGKIGLVTE